jgi:hypothetical protein
VVARWHLRWLILGTLLVAAFGLSRAHAACEAPSVLLDGPTKLRAGDSITVRGEDWSNECNDTTVCGSGCGGRCVGPEPERPLRNITILMTPATTGKGSLGLGGFVLAEDIDAASDLTFDLDVSIPSRAPPGGYRLAAQVDDGDDLILGSRFRVVD